jgi:hypothetical protein
MAVALGVLLPVSRAAATERHLELLASLKGVKEVVFPVGPDPARPAVRITCSSLSVERKAWGFMKLGILPEVLAKGLTLKVDATVAPEIWTGELGRFLAANPSLQHAEIRDFKLVVGEPPRVSVSAAKARFRAGAQGILLREVRVERAGMQSPALGASAFIPLGGNSAGIISLRLPLGEVVDIPLGPCNRLSQ